MVCGRPRKSVQPVGERILRNYGFLKRLASTRSERRRLRQIAGASPDELLAIVEASANVLEGLFCLSQRQLQRILPYREAVQRLARARSERGARRAAQVGGGLPLLFGSLLTPILADAAHHLIRKVAGGSSDN